MNTRPGIRPVVGLIFLLVLAAFSTAALAIPDFTFIHASDVHAPTDTSLKVTGEIRPLSEIEMTPYGIKAKSPAFIVVSGDVTEFGGGAGAWDAYMSYWKGFTVPVYHQLGNHDGPWFVNRPHLRKLYGGAVSWSFDKFHCHFIGLDNSTPHDPRANITQEQFAWLKNDLKKVQPSTPIFLVIHHPLDDSYFGSPYAVYRFLDLLRPYNLVAVFMGHGHSANVMKHMGVDNIQGGAVCGPIPKCVAGFGVVDIRNDTLRVAYKAMGESAANKAIIEKPIPDHSTYPKIEILSPSENGTRSEGPLSIRAKISGNESPIAKATWSVDRTSFDEKNEDGENPMEYREGIWCADMKYDEWVPGAHYVRVMFVDRKGERFTKCVRFNTEPPPSRLVWRAFLDGSCRGAATVVGNTVFIGATDMKLYALDKATGKTKWAYPTGGDVCTQPLVVGDTVYFGSGDGNLYAVSTSGKLKWSFPTKEGVYSSPVYSDGLVLFGSDDSSFYAVDAKTGKQAWVLEDPAYTIEVKPFVADGVVYFGAWDEYVYAVDVKTGKLKWKCQGNGSATQAGAKRYYSPADAGPVASGGRVFVADRNSDISIIDAAEGTILKADKNCVSVGISEDGKSVYERKPGGGLAKVDLDGNEIWRAADAETDSIPSAPIEKDGIVYTVSRLGLVQAFKATDGSLLWEYQATPQLYVLTEVEVADGVVYVSGMDGSLTAIKAK